MSSACRFMSGAFASSIFFSGTRVSRHSRRALADDAGSAHLCRAIRSARERQRLQHGQAAVIHQETGRMAHIPHHVDDRRARHRDGVSGQNLDVVLQIVGQVPGQVQS